MNNKLSSLVAKLDWKKVISSQTKNTIYLKLKCWGVIVCLFVFPKLHKIYFFTFLVY